MRSPGESEAITHTIYARHLSCCVGSYKRRGFGTLPFHRYRSLAAARRTRCQKRNFRHRGQVCPAEQPSWPVSGGKTPSQKRIPYVSPPVVTTTLPAERPTVECSNLWTDASIPFPALSADDPPKCTMEPYPRDEAFAVIRLDPVASVRHLKDPEALRAARALTPRTYLVYLFEVSTSPHVAHRHHLEF